MVTSPDLETDRLRPLAAGDADTLFSIFSDPPTVEFIEWEPFQGISQALWLLGWARTESLKEPRPVFVWGIEWRDVEESVLLGVVTLIIRDPNLREADIGYVLDRAVWGRCIATEAMRVVIEAAFVRLQLRRLTAGCHPGNAASARVLDKAGMRREGCLIQHKWEKGLWRDTVLFALLDHEFIARPPVPGA